MIDSYIQMKSQPLAGSALVALGVATGSLLAPQAASALDFTFSVSQLNGVTGLITGLVEGTNSCTVGGACLVTVLDDGATGLPTGNYFNSSPNPFGIFEGFTVSGNSITAYSFFGSQSGLLPVDVGLIMPVLVLEQFFLSSNNGLGRYEPLDGGGTVLTTESSGGALTVSFEPSTPASSVPGPLPLFGAAAAFGFSRKLRKRIKSIAID